MTKRSKAGGRDPREHLEDAMGDATDALDGDEVIDAIDALADELESGDAGAPEAETDFGSLSPEDQVVLLEAELVKAKEERLRALADFRNFQARSMDNERHAREEGRTSVIRALMPSMDNLDLALLQQDTGTPAEQLVAGMRSVSGQIREAFDQLGVNVVRPEAGDEFDPHLHSAMLQQPTPDVDPGRVVSVMQSGYVLGERVLRPAGVIVAIEMPDDSRAEEAGDTTGASVDPEASAD